MDVLKSIIVWFVAITFIIIFFPIIFIVWLFVLPFDRKRTVVHWMLIFHAMAVSYLVPIWKIKIEGRKKAVKGTTYIIISNHQSILDILLIDCLRYRFKWISKIENKKVPILGLYIKMADYITVDRDDKESKERMLVESLKRLEDGTSLMFYPEGTRSSDSQIGFFKRGAFQLALSANTPILPILIDGTGDILPKHGFIFGGFHEIYIKVLDPVMPSAFGTQDCYELAMKFQMMMTDALRKIRNEKKT
jgi:1-acyl-sn-glycerol-3-phosphate acyltransferase